MNSIKLACGVLATALFVAGCGSKPDTATLQPRIPAGTSAALVARDHATITPATGQFKKLLQDLDKNPSKDDQAAAAFFRETGLIDAQIRWMAASTGKVNPPATDGTQETPEAAYAISVHHDIERIVAGVKEQTLGEADTLTPGEFAGLKGWNVVTADLPPDVKPCFASLDGEIILVATSPAVLERVIRLYRDGEAADAAFADFGTSPDTILAARLVRLGNLVGMFTTAEKITRETPVFLPIPELGRIVLGLGDLDFDLTVSPDRQDLNASLRLATANAQDAIKLREPLQASLLLAKTFLRAGLKKSGKGSLSKEELRQCRKVIDSLSVGGAGAVVEVSTAVPVSMLTNSVNQATKYRGK